MTTKRIVLSTSSSCLDYVDIPHQVELLRLHLKINGVDFLDGKNITPSRLADIMTSVPSTSAKSSPPTVADVMDKFDELIERGYSDVFIITLSAKLSESYQNIMQAKQHYEQRLNIRVYNSRTVNFTEGVLALEADRLLQEGKSFADIVEHLDALRACNTFTFTVSDLSHLIRNKKLSAPAGFFANLFDIKPVLEITQDGEITTKQKIRKTDKALEHMAQQLSELKQGKDSFCYIMDTGNPTLTAQFNYLLRSKYGMSKVPAYPVSPISIANHGIDVMGFGLFTGQIPEIFKATT